MEKTSQAMNASKAMALFHLSFTVLSITALFLMAMEIIAFDWLALWIIVLAVALNAFFAVMWHDENTKIKTEKGEPTAEIVRAFSMVSFVIPAHNQERNISSCVKSLFNCAKNYRGPSEIIIIDDGSTDDTYQCAWSAIESLQKESPHIRARVLKHMAHMGKQQAVRTGASKAMGEYVAIVDASTPCDQVSLNNLIDTLSSTHKIMLSHEIRPPPQEGKTALTSVICLYRADVLRHALNEEIAEELKL